MSAYVRPGDNNFSGLDRGYNQRFRLSSSLSSARGEGVYVVESAEDIRDTLNGIAGGSSLSPGEIRATSGGHCYENFVFQESSSGSSNAKYVMDLNTMKGIQEISGLGDGKTYIAIEAGVSNWQAQTTLHAKYGKTIPSGSCYSVASGGHIAGGGYGLLSRLHGLAVDYLAGVEMVIPDLDVGGFKVRSFNPLEDGDDLDWASRGGGAGHFGIITKYYFDKDRLPLAPEGALFISIPIPWAQFTNGDIFTNFLNAYYDACAALPPQAFTLGKFFAKVDDASEMAVSIQVVYGDNSGHSTTSGGVAYSPITRDGAVDVINTFWDGINDFSPDRKTLNSRPARTIELRGHPVTFVHDLGKLYDLPWIEMTQLLNGSGENKKGKYKSSYMITNFSTDEGRAMYDFLADSNSEAPASAVKSDTLIQIDSYGMQVNEMDPDNNTAIAARNSVLKI
ncbi:MAG: FAD-binding protein, partial [Spirochaetota bacterium]